MIKLISVLIEIEQYMKLLKELVHTLEKAADEIYWDTIQS